MTGPEEILKFWLDDVGPQKWFEASDELDAEIYDRFSPALTGASEGRFSLWLTYPSGALAYIILTDQFSRNMYRGSGKSFATDRIALAAAKSAIGKGWDLKIDEPARQFFYLPLMHSENLCDQDRCVRLICERMPEHGASNLLHARAHRAVIRQFGRFPARNAALQRPSTQAEADYVRNGGYGTTVRDLQAAKAA
ncbi:DUF924 domain-containing protein [Roseobacter denitrificans]|uniref:DUF924 domain-containing protein n=1 Tax=Roseobacter denitrificans (strain ATCC 33942 / OCh 114) TaxID=375451 RepID=Q164S8_ROSDO|nr:DUF924 family protein [Roseobacter denitrificans]ABG32515.1 conserved hypothetical protein [Roseobacter denitrificans OCh 114]AVL51965.1 DUF924 domain-containing protein [Roseobacter denitrificans]SFF82908.1 Uncharacterized conserved protein, DUF924 family [Roseobacter denitrificans OCh 114]